MDKIILPDKGVELETRFAAPSVLTGRFVCAVVNSDIGTVRDALDHPGRIIVHNTDELYADKIYAGYGAIHSIEESGGEIIAKIDREANA